jgi:hypothetical protein
MAERKPARKFTKTASLSIGVAVAALVVLGLVAVFGMRGQVPVSQTTPYPEAESATEPIPGGAPDGAVSIQRDGVHIPAEASERIEGDGLATEAESGEQLFEGAQEDPDLMQPGQRVAPEGQAGPDARPGPGSEGEGG